MTYKERRLSKDMPKTKPPREDIKDGRSKDKAAKDNLKLDSGHQEVVLFHVLPPPCFWPAASLPKRPPTLESKGNHYLNGVFLICRRRTMAGELSTHKPIYHRLAYFQLRLDRPRRLSARRSRPFIKVLLPTSLLGDSNMDKLIAVQARPDTSYSLDAIRYAEKMMGIPQEMTNYWRDEYDIPNADELERLEDDDGYPQKRGYTLVSPIWQSTFTTELILRPHYSRERATLFWDVNCGVWHN
ncbi:hypothetical protein GALMADRAFT_214474 [Galerina marginata CBS 339.88]|uniref:Uncharacterized protein n=1 Tax=Galerina marginata (strain CBS 339.88) TaxID=685588 RepID=A0A067SRK7_GALM3|nr:hypothetical protein GALMADRAFT_214474 [Galerina marginata CBS 339.88]